MTFIFDLDGTLVDSKPGILACFQHMFAVLNRACPPDAVLASSIGLPFRQAVGHLLKTSDPSAIEQAVQIYRQRYATAGLYEAAVYGGVPEMLTAIRGTAFVATSKAQVFAEQVLAHFGLAKRFRRICGPDVHGRPAEKDELLQQLLRAEGIDGHAVMIGDRSEDIRAAASNGLRGVGVLWGYGSERELMEAGAATVCTTPAELAVYLAGLPL
jgi:phosphoglycolate phosphatase